MNSTPYLMANSSTMPCAGSTKYTFHDSSYICTHSEHNASVHITLHPHCMLPSLCVIQLLKSPRHVTIIQSCQLACSWWPPSTYRQTFISRSIRSSCISSLLPSPQTMTSCYTPENKSWKWRNSYRPNGPRHMGGFGDGGGEPPSPSARGVRERCKLPHCPLSRPVVRCENLVSYNRSVFVCQIFPEISGVLITYPKHHSITSQRAIYVQLWPAGHISSCWPAAARFSEHGQRVGYELPRWLRIHAHCGVIAETQVSGHIMLFRVRCQSHLSHIVRSWR